MLSFAFRFFTYDHHPSLRSLAGSPPVGASDVNKQQIDDQVDSTEPKVVGIILSFVKLFYFIINEM